MTFLDFKLDDRLQEGLDAMGFSKPTPIQEQAIPIILQNKDVIACAQTGTGKTASYLLPVMNKMIKSDHRHLDTLIIVPTRELAQQIDQQVEGFGYFTGVSSIPVYGGGDGAAWDQQRKALEQGADIIIATPGRLIAMLQTGTIDLSRLNHLILDEADRMLDMGFFDDILRIINHLPPTRQTLLFSATMPPRIRQLANKILREPVEITIAIAKPASGILQQAYICHEQQKHALLNYILKTVPWNSAIIFSSTKEMVKKLYNDLKRSGLSVKSFHSDLEQAEREEIMRAFRNRQVQLLIGTDVLSRGIDVEGISLVVNWDVPPDPEDYVHRVGRTARAETTGTAITLVNENDQRRFSQIESLIGSEIPKPELPSSIGRGPTYDPSARRSKPTAGNQRQTQSRNTPARPKRQCGRPGPTCGK
ncbi:MAG: DEAD/DEAH box helicase [Cyclobacteriaceae bacterium]